VLCVFYCHVFVVVEVFSTKDTDVEVCNFVALELNSVDYGLYSFLSVANYLLVLYNL